MLSSITPLGERGRGQRFWITATAYVTGAVLGGAAIGLVAAALGAGVRAAGLGEGAASIVAVLLAVVAIAADWPGSPIRVPRWRRQVDEDWLTRYRGWVYGFGFGFQLGSGAVTIVISAVIYLAFALAVLSGSVASAVAIGLAFGTTKGLILLAGARIDDADALVGFHRRLEAGRSWSTRAAVGGDLAALGLGVVAIGAVACA